MPSNTKTILPVLVHLFALNTFKQDIYHLCRGARGWINNGHFSLAPDSLFIKGAAAAGGRAVFVEGLREILVQSVSHAAWDPFPG